MSSNTKKKVRIVLMLAVALITTRGMIATAGDIRVEPQCPSSISPGENLLVDLRLTNLTQTQTICPTMDQTQCIKQQTGVPVTIAKSALIAHIGNLNLLGPFSIPLAETIAPQSPITINPQMGYFFPQLQNSDFVSITTKGYLNLAFPKNAVKGAFTTLLVSVLDINNRQLGTGTCTIEVQ